MSAAWSSCEADEVERLRVNIRLPMGGRRELWLAELLGLVLVGTPCSLTDVEDELMRKKLRSFDAMCDVEDPPSLLALPKCMAPDSGVLADFVGVVKVILRSGVAEWWRGVELAKSWVISECGLSGVDGSGGSGRGGAVVVVEWWQQ